MNKYVEILILFISEYGYIKAEDFIHFAYSNIDEYEQLLDEDTYLSLLSMSFADNQSVVDFTNRLREFAEKNYAPEISNINNDVYVDGVIESDRNDYTAKCLRKLYERRDRAEMDLADITAKEDIIKLIKQCIFLPSWCGNGWDAMNDILGEGDFPIVLEVKNIEVLERRLPEDAEFLKRLLERSAPKYCTVKYIQ